MRIAIILSILFFFTSVFTIIVATNPKDSPKKMAYRGTLVKLPFNDLTDTLMLNDESQMTDSLSQIQEFVLRENGRIILYNDGRISTNGISSGLNLAVNALRKNDHTISDMALSESNQWVIIYDKNKYLSANLPYEMRLELDDYQKMEQQIHTVALNAVNDWLIIGDSTFSTSNFTLKQYIDYGQRKLGGIETAHLDDQSLLVFLQNGVIVHGTLPENVDSMITHVSKPVARCRYYQTGEYFIRYYDGSVMAKLNR
jgi:hypothetical protein